ncbi:PrgI family protein [Kineosporia sp. J2-2]|uniref:PrgI family protein n=1 Tax=Kineosporia corallincola TaxID=2835133 RepID=A0ABS5TTN9_9ACTN|nr:PrgI family protein [Kineosporia corallincola]MBT0774181.1 PrgI family protein [Kineosporia corallincola]
MTRRFAVWSACRHRDTPLEGARPVPEPDGPGCLFVSFLDEGMRTMNASVSEPAVPVRARIPADLDLEDPVVAGLSVHQALVLASVAVPVMLAWQVLDARIPAIVFAGGAALVLGATVALVLLHRDGLSLDRWLLAAVRYRLRPRAWSVQTDFTQVPAERGRAPVAAITQEGVLVHPDGLHVVLVACTTIPSILATDQDDAVLAAGMARWLNSLSGPVQIVVRNRPSDLAAVAATLAEEAATLANPALARLALDHAGMLLDLAETERPLQRTVVIACSGGLPSGGQQLRHLLPRNRFWSRRRSAARPAEDLDAGGERRQRLLSPSAAAQALSRARRTVAELGDLGADAVVLGGLEVQQVLAGAWTPCLLASNPDHGARLYDVNDVPEWDVPEDFWEERGGSAGRGDLEFLQETEGHDAVVPHGWVRQVDDGWGGGASAGGLDDEPDDEPAGDVVSNGPSPGRSWAGDEADVDGEDASDPTRPDRAVETPGAGGAGSQRRVPRMLPLPGGRRIRPRDGADPEVWAPDRGQR